MSLDVARLDALRSAYGAVLRIVVADLRGSAPRETGAEMRLWDGGQEGTIGGGALEWAAMRAARDGHRGMSRHPLGPALGQCCGGHVTLWTEAWDGAAIRGGVRAAGVGAAPGGLDAALRAARAGLGPLPRTVGDWIVEAACAAADPVWIWGAGHVGRALAAVLAPLPGVDLVWADVDRDRFPEVPPEGVAPVWGDLPALALRAPEAARHLIVTHSHDLDLALCHALLRRPAAEIGLIGSATKWRRFRARLGALGHGAADMARITCPIGAPALGKHPQAIAVGVAAALLAERAREPRRAAG